MNVPSRTASLTAGIALAAMSALAPLGVMIALPAGSTGIAALVVIVVAVLDVVVAAGLFFLMREASPLLASVQGALRIAYAAVFASAAGSLAAPADVDRFQAIWDMGLGVFGAHLMIVGVIAMRTAGVPTWIGALVAIAGLGYAVDAAIVALAPHVTFSVGAFSFVGEVALLVWLIGWGGRRPLSARPWAARRTQRDLGRMSSA